MNPEETPKPDRFSRARTGQGIQAPPSPFSEADLLEVEENKKRLELQQAAQNLNDHVEFPVQEPQEYRSTPVHHILLDDMPPADLLMLHARIGAMLSDAGLAKLDLEQEFLVQLAHARGIQQLLREGDGKANEQAAALNGVTTILKEIVKLREAVSNIEKIQKLEGIIVRVMKTQPAEVREDFMERYRDLVGVADV